MIFLDVLFYQVPSSCCDVLLCFTYYLLIDVIPDLDTDSRPCLM